jgi:hypothetical protein
MANLSWRGIRKAEPVDFTSPALAGRSDVARPVECVSAVEVSRDIAVPLVTVSYVKGLIVPRTLRLIRRQKIRVRVNSSVIRRGRGSLAVQGGALQLRC